MIIRLALAAAFLVFAQDSAMAQRRGDTPAPQKKEARQLPERLQKFDLDGDGKLNEAERASVREARKAARGKRRAERQGDGEGERGERRRRARRRGDGPRGRRHRGEGRGTGKGKGEGRGKEGKGRRRGQKKGERKGETRKGGNETA